MFFNKTMLLFILIYLAPVERNYFHDKSSEVTCSKDFLCKNIYISKKNVHGIVITQRKYNN